MTSPTLREALEARVADRIQERMGPLFGSPEYLADPVKLARAQKRQRESAESWAKIAVAETLVTTSHEAGRRAALEEAAAIVEAQRETFLTPEYATGQPLSSFQERFACTLIAAAIRNLAGEGVGGVTNADTERSPRPTDA